MNMTMASNKNGIIEPEAELDGDEEELDGDEEELDADEEESLYSAPAEQQDLEALEIDVKEDPFQIIAIVHKIDRGQILIPDFQRKEVWDQTRRSEFIESILLNYPLPPLYFNQDRKGRYIVVDGLQRTSTVYRFVKNQFALTGLKKLSWLNGKRFSDLDPPMQARIEDRKLNCNVLKPSVKLDDVYDIFARINRGGMPLNRQEIRHGLYQGKATALLKAVAASPPFASWIGRRMPRRRMRDEEAALRCIAFTLMDPETYRNDMDEFLGLAMGALNSAEISQIQGVTATFIRVFHSARVILGVDAFRIPTTRSRGQLNVAIMESVYRFFATHDDKWLTQNAEQLEERYRALLENAEYLDAVRVATGNTRRVRARFRLADEVLRG